MTSQVKKAWTAFTTAFFALIAMLGFAAPAPAAPRTGVPAPADLPEMTGRAASIPGVRTSPESESKSASDPELAVPDPTLPLAWWALPKDRSLPPTIKQRIRAEAHGSTPGTRHLPLDSDAASDAVARDAAIGEAVLQPA